MKTPYGTQTTLINQDYNCQLCALGKARAHANTQLKAGQPLKQCIPGAGPRDLKTLKLIVISDYPGHYEELYGWPQVDINSIKGERKNGVLLPRNSGAFLRMVISGLLGLDSYKDVWMTNAVKCNPAKTKVIESAHLKPCVRQWLGPELLILDQECPKVPLLVAGLQAFRAVKMLYRQHTTQLETLGFNGCRRRNDLTLNGRPVVFAPNPARPARSEPRIESTVLFNGGKWVVGENEWLYPPPLGSPVRSFIEDLKFLAPLLR